MGVRRFGMRIGCSFRKGCKNFLSYRLLKRLCIILLTGSILLQILGSSFWILSSDSNHSRSSLLIGIAPRPTGNAPRLIVNRHCRSGYVYNVSLNTSFVASKKSRNDVKFHPSKTRKKIKEDQFREYFGAYSETLLRNQFTNTHDFEFSINNEKACPGDTFLVSIIHSAPNNTMKRDLVRHTWGSYANCEVYVVRPVFLVGQVDDKAIQNMLIQESRTHQDIVQGNFYDSYKNLTYKNIMGLHWLVHYCNHTRFVLKVDDDVIINIHRLVTGLVNQQNVMETKRLIYCFIYTLMPTQRKGKWKVTIGDYPYKLYPPYCQGFAYLMTMTVVRGLYDASVSVKHFWIDDVFVTGLLAEKAHVQLNTFPYGLTNKDIKGVIESSHMSRYGIFLSTNTIGLKSWKRIWSFITT